MKKTVWLDDFHNAFIMMGRDDNYSWEGLDTLFEMLVAYEDADGEEIELDVIALCCQYVELTIEDLIEDYKFVEDKVNEWQEKTWASGERCTDEMLHDVIENILDNVGAIYFWINDDSLILDVESFR